MRRLREIIRSYLDLLGRYEAGELSSYNVKRGR